MDINRFHHYTFHVETTIAEGSARVPVSFRVGCEAPTHADGLNLVSAHYPAAERVYLASIERIGDGCGDDRCAVCNPSSRNVVKL